MEPYFWVIGIILIAIFLLSNLKGSGSVDDRIRYIQSQSRDMGIIRARYHTARTNYNVDYNNALTAHVTAVHNLDLAPLRLEWARQQQQATYENFMVVAQAASQSRTDINTYNQLKLAEGTAQVEVLKAQQLKQIDYEFLEKEHKLQLEGAMFLALKEQRQLEGLMKMFEIMVRKRYEIETGDDPPEVRQRLLDRCDRNLQILDGVMNGNRLLQENNGQDA